MGKKPRWGKPKLIVLVRGDRQERVLTVCKWGDEVPGDPSDIYGNCIHGDEPCFPCGEMVRS